MTSTAPFMRLTGTSASTPAASTSLAPTNTAAPSAAATAAGNAPIVWLTLEQAAQRSGLSLGQLRRRCLEGWADAHLARKVASGAKPSWQIAQHADAMFAAVKFPEQLKADLTSLSDQQRQQCMARKATLDAWLEARRGGVQLGIAEEIVTEKFIERRTHLEGKSISRATLFNWLRNYTADGLMGLVDGRGKHDQAKVRDADPFFSCLATAYLNDRRPSIKTCYEIAVREAAAQRGGDISGLPAYATAYRYLKALPPQLVVLKRQGKKAFNDTCLPYIKRDYSMLASNEIWCGDHHQFDVMVLMGKDAKGLMVYGRPWVTAWEDLASRRIVGWHITANNPNTDTIIRALHHGCSEWGLPGRVMIDNGKDYDSIALQGRTKKQRRAGIDEDRVRGVMGVLDIAVEHVQPYHGQSKPIERLFGTVCDRFSRTFESYCGNKPDNRPESFQRHLDAGRAPTFEEFVADFADYLDTDYHARVHTGHAMNGMNPAAAFEAKLQSRRVVSAEMLKFACLTRHGPVKVGRQGVTYKGEQYGAFDAQVSALFRRQVLLGIDRDDLDEVYLLDLQGRLLCPARKNLTLAFNANTDDQRAAAKAKANIKRITTQYDKIRPLISTLPDDHSHLARAAAERAKRQRANPAPDNCTPPPLVPHRTGYEDQHEQIRTAMTGTDAVAGAGAVDIRSLFGGGYDSDNAGDTDNTPRLRLADAGGAVRGGNDEP